MGLFDFFKPKQNDVFDNKKFARELLQNLQADNDEVARVVEYCNGLKSAGREREAISEGRAYLTDLAKCCFVYEDPEYRRGLRVYERIARGIGEEIFAKTTLDIVIRNHHSASKGGVLDTFLTDPLCLYLVAGDLVSSIPGWEEEAYRCFWMAAESRPPKGCKIPASSEDRIITHSRAWRLCSVHIRLNTPDQAEWVKRRAWHDAKRRELDPDRNWDASLQEFTKSQL